MKYKKSSLLIFLLLIFMVNFSAIVNINALNGSSVFVDGVMYEVISGNQVSLQLNDGTHTIKISKQGYTDYTETVNLNGDQNYILKVEQSPLSRLIFDNTMNIEVSYDYQNKKITKKLDKENATLNVPSSIKKIEVKSEGYQPKIINLNLLPFDEENISLSLLKDNYFVLDSYPSNADVFVGDEFIGKTPIELNKNLSNSIIIKKEKYIPYKLNYNGENSLKVNLTSGVNLSIQSVPTGAAIYNGDEFMGVTPFNATVKPDNYALKITYMGYDTKNLNIEVNKESYNNYRVILDKKMVKMELFNSDNVELNIDGNYIGSGVKYIYIDNLKHLVKVKNEDKIYSFVLSKDIGEYIDFNKNTFINVISKDNKTFSINSKTYNSPKTIKLDLLADTQYFTLNTVSKSYNLKLNSGNGYNIFLDDSSVVFYGTNVKNSNLYVDGKLFVDKVIIPVNKKSISIKSTFENKVNEETINIKGNKSTDKTFNIEKTYPVRIDSTDSFVIGNKVYNETPYYVYLKSGANVIEYKGVKIVIFVYGPEYINLDSIL